MRPCSTRYHAFAGRDDLLDTGFSRDRLKTPHNELWAGIAKRITGEADIPGRTFHTRILPASNGGLSIVPDPASGQNKRRGISKMVSFSSSTQATSFNKAGEVHGSGS